MALLTVLSACAAPHAATEQEQPRDTTSVMLDSIPPDMLRLMQMPGRDYTGNITTIGNDADGRCTLTVDAPDLQGRGFEVPQMFCDSANNFIGTVFHIRITDSTGRIDRIK